MKKLVILALVIAVSLVFAMVANVEAAPVCTETYFDDVTAASVGSAFCGYIETFYDLGITAGCSVSPPLYCPDDYVDRKQMAVFITEAMGGTYCAGNDASDIMVKGGAIVCG